MDNEQVIRLKNRQKVMKSRVKDIGEKMRDISSTVTGYKSMTTSLIIGFAAAMLFIAGQVFGKLCKADGHSVQSGGYPQSTAG